jgi:Zn-dependent peptidase ImmA (M78 family)
VPAFRRGFKSEVDRLIREVRADFGCRALDALDPSLLAAHLRIPVVGVSACEPAVLAHFRVSSLSARFHAATVAHRAGAVIVHNDSAPLTRQRSNIAHELGHVLLEHDLFPVNTEDGPHRDSAVEREAAWFGFALLITTQAALKIARLGMEPADGASLLGVSEDALRYRMDVTGATKRVRAEQLRRR